MKRLALLRRALFDDFCRHAGIVDSYVQAGARMSRARAPFAVKARRIAKNRAYYMLHREAQIARIEAWKKRNPERVHAYYLNSKPRITRYQIDHRERINALTRARRAANPSKFRAREKAYNSEHREMINARRRARYPLIAPMLADKRIHMRIHMTDAERARLRAQRCSRYHRNIEKERLRNAKARIRRESSELGADTIAQIAAMRCLLSKLTNQIILPKKEIAKWLLQIETNL